MWKALLATVPFLLLGVDGHGNMVWPPIWLDSEGSIGLQPGGQCWAAGGTTTPNCMWFTNFTFTDGEVRLPEWLRTYNDIYPGYDYTKAHPWRSPGRAPVFSPCGVAGGNPFGCPVGDPEDRNCPGGGFSNGVGAEDYDFPGVQTTQWQRGQPQQVGWGIIANHGGGYSYRLCKDGQELTEECFQATVLDFASDIQWVQYGEGGERVEFVANRTREGTFPPGSQWSRNPIPACIEPDGGYMQDNLNCDQGTQFPPPAPGLFGYGENHVKPGEPAFKWTLMDEVVVPEELEAGQYTLSFRWDCEQTSQIWSACASVELV